MKKVVGLMMAILIVAMGCAGIAEERKTIAYSTQVVDSDGTRCSTGLCGSRL